MFAVVIAMGPSSVVACGSGSTGPGTSASGGTSSGGTSTGGAGGASTGGASTTGPGGSGGVGGTGGLTVAPPVELGWDDATAAAGLAGVESSCRTASMADMDGDGAADIVLPDGGEVRIYRNDGAGHFQPWATIPTPELALATMNCPMAIADLDGDGRRDVAVGLDGKFDPLTTGVVVLFNDGGGAFTRVAATTKLPSVPPKPGGVTRFSVFALGVVQAQGEGPLLLLANELDGAAGSIDLATCGYDPSGVVVECPTQISAPRATAYRVLPGRKVELAPGTGLEVEGNAQGLGVTDLDGDGDDDVLVALDFLPQKALRRQGSGYADVSAAWGVSLFAHGMGVALGDVDDDGRTDAVFTTIGGLVDLQGLGASGFASRGAASAYRTRRRSIWPWSALFVDLDANGHQDLLVINEWASQAPDPVAWLQTIGGPADFQGAFQTVVFKDSATTYREGFLPYESMLPGHARPKTVAVADVDGDGRPELLELLLRASDHQKSGLVLGRVSGPSGHGLTVRLGARAAAGTRVSLTCGGRTQERRLYGAEGMGAAARAEAHFGCGAATTYDALRVEPRGLPAIDLPGGPLDRAVWVDVP